MGLFPIARVFTDSPTVTLMLPKELTNQRIHPTFHVSLIRPHVANNDALFPNRDVSWAFQLEDSVGGEWHVDEIIDHHHSGQAGWEFRVLLRIQLWYATVGWKTKSLISQVSFT